MGLKVILKCSFTHVVSDMPTWTEGEGLSCNQYRSGVHNPWTTHGRV